jgi:Cof subfamily protein (haloacid dehalogenase superfamily)
MFTAPFYYEFTAKNVDKAKAIDTAFTKLGYTADEMIAFGDAENDISMLEYAGIGVAMGNATEAVKAIADEITLSNDEDGIAESLYKHIEGLR